MLVKSKNGTGEYLNEMNIKKTPIAGLLIFEPKVFTDARGAFFESFNKKVFDEATGGQFEFVQDNQSLSHKNVVRGLHFQNPPHAQGKLVRVIKGAALDVAVDIRLSSETYGQYFSIELSEENGWMFWIPPGFAHGFKSLEIDTIFSYKCTNYYAPESEGTIRWNDTTLNINWGSSDCLVSEKDINGQEFHTFASHFHI